MTCWHGDRGTCTLPGFGGEQLEMHYSHRPASSADIRNSLAWQSGELVPGLGQSDL